MEGVEIFPGLQPDRLQPKRIDFVPVDKNITTRSEFEADQVIVAIGQKPSIEGIGEGLALTLTTDGYLRVDPGTGSTSNPKIFAGGDLVKGEQTVTDAMAMGLRAAWGIDASLRGLSKANRKPPPRHASPLEDIPEPIPVPDWFHAARIKPEELSPETRTGTFEEVVRTFSEGKARAEAARCLMCGQCGNCRACIELFGCPAIQEDKEDMVIIDSTLCTGCGVCAELCPNGAFRVVSHV
jgi:heterodisulfide reductase subunit A-like polyferredoxin